MILYVSLAFNALTLAVLIAAVVYVWPGVQIVRRARILLS